jgi:peptidoglycan-associated lipoprotein
VNFEFNRAQLTIEAQTMLQAHAECLRQAREVTVVIEGHCDERGTQEFNLALGQDRAESVVAYLTTLGVDTDRLRALSKGKNQPVCTNADEACFARNRRVELIGR